MARTLASVVEISKVSPIEGADRLEVAEMVGKGWKVVIPKDEFHEGDLAVFFEIDSALDPNDERYAFLKDRCLRKFVSKSGNVLREVIKIKTIKLRGQISQGLLMPMDKYIGKELHFSVRPATPDDCQAEDGMPLTQEDLEGVEVAEIFYIKHHDAEEGTPAFDEKVIVLPGTDLTSLLHVEHFDEIKEQLQPAMGNPLCADAKGLFPSDYVPKSDEDRLQGHLDFFEKYKGLTFEVTAKDDGSSETIAYSPTIDENDPLVVCSRNLRLKRPEEGGKVSAFWQVVAKYGIEDKLKSLYESTGKEYALQGECVGCGINGNKDRYSDFEFHVFRIWDIRESHFVAPEERREICKRLDIPHVQVVAEKFPFFDKITTMEEALKFAEGKTLRGNEREGVVLKQDDGKGDLHFKIVSNKYLLKMED